MNKTIMNLRRIAAVALCLVLFPGGQAWAQAAADSAPAVTEVSATPYGLRIADPDTTDGYIDEMLNGTNGNLYAGRIWTDKTVFAHDATPEEGGLEDNVLVLDPQSDGTAGSVGFDADFLSVYSALGSSQVINEHIDAPSDLVIVLDMSGSMAQSTQFPVGAEHRNGYQETMEERIQNSRVQKTLDAVNETIDSLMAENPQNRVAVCVYGANAAVLMPLAHYQRIDGQPYLTIGGMETLYDREDYSTPAELGWTQPGLTDADGIWNINRDACYTVVANALYDQSYTAPETYVEVWNRTISNNVRNGTLHPDPDLDRDGRQLNADQYVGYMTNTQGGIFLGMKQLADTSDMTYVEELPNGEISTVARIPAVMVLTDGGANFAFNLPTEDAQHELPQNAGDEWYDVYLPKEDITTLYNEGVSSNMLTSIPAYTDSGIFYDSDMDVGGTPSTILEVLMTASYMKTVVEKHYENGWDEGMAVEDSRIPLRIYTVSVDAEHLPAWGRYRIYPTMDPQEYFNATRWDDDNYASIGNDFLLPLPWLEEQDIQMQDLLPYTYGKWEEWQQLTASDSTISLLADWVGNAGSSGYETVTLDEAGVHSVAACSTLRIGLLPEGHTYVRTDDAGSALEEIEVSNQDVIDHINYPDRFYDVESADLGSVFREVLDLLTNNIFVPVEGRNAAGVEDSVTYRDLLGPYMQVKSGALHLSAPAEASDSAGESSGGMVTETCDLAALLFGGLYGMVRTAVYDSDFTESYLAGRDDAESEFVEGWYRGDDPETAEFREGNDAPADPWNDGWVYRIGPQTLVDYLPTLNSVEELAQSPEHASYTIYRFTDSQEERNYLHINPAYGSAVPVSLELAWNELEEKPAEDDMYSGETGIYRLSDIRVWTESDASAAQASADSCALYVNIPASALPTQTARFTIGADGSGTYETNVGDRTQSTPFRLFYALGLDEDKIQRDADSGNAWADIDSIPQEYRRNHGGDSYGSTYFLPGEFGNADASAGVDGADDDSGSASVTFSAGPENSYYLHQDAVPLSTHAWRVVDARPESGYGLAAVDNADGRSAGSAAAGNSGTHWEDGNVGGAGWAGGDYMGTYRDEQAYAAARDAVRSVEGVDSIEDSYGNLYPFAQDGIIFLERDLLTEQRLSALGAGEQPLEEQDYYFFVNAYYLPGAQGEHVARSAWRVACSRAGNFVPSGDTALRDLLCWVDYSGRTDMTFDFVEGSDITHGAPTFAKLTYRPFGLREYLQRSGVPEDELEEQMAQCLELQEAFLPLLDANDDGMVSNLEYRDAGFHWVLAVGPGSSRSGEMAITARVKQSNITRSARNSYTPLRSVALVANAAGEAANAAQFAANAVDTQDRRVIRDALGNNGKLTVSNSQLFITNRLEAAPGAEGTQFNYQIYVEDMTGTQEAVVLRYNPRKNHGEGGWQQQLSTLDVGTNGAGLLLDANGAPATVDRSGRSVNAPEAAEQEELYYVCLAPDGGTENRIRIFHGEAQEDDPADAALAGMGCRIYTAGEPDADLVAEGEYWTLYRPEDADHPSGTVEYFSKEAWLIPTGLVDGGATSPEARAAAAASWHFGEKDRDACLRVGYGEAYSESVQPLLLARVEADAEDTGVKISSDFDIRANYLTRTLRFGSIGEEDAPRQLTSADLLDTTPFWQSETGCVAIPGQQRAVMETAVYARAMELTEQVEWISWDEVAAHTAGFTLADGEGLLLSVHPGLGYRVTQEGRNAEGFLLQEAMQEESDGGICYAINDMNEPGGCAIVSAWHELRAADRSAHQSCGRFPEGPDEYVDGRLARHWYIYDTLQLDYGTENLPELLAQARFSREGGERRYSLCGTEDGAQSGVHFVNTAAPASLVISNWLASSGENVTLGEEDMQREFRYTISFKDGDGKKLSDLSLPYVLTGYEGALPVQLESGTLSDNQFTLQGSQQLRISGLPEAYSCTIEQSPVAEFIGSGTPLATKGRDQSVTLSVTSDGRNGPQLATFLNRKAVRPPESDESEGFNLLFWLPLAAALLIEIIVHIVTSRKKNR